MALAPSGIGFSGTSDGDRLYFNQHVCMDQARDLHHARCGTDIAEEFTVSAANFLPTADVGYIHSRPNHVLQPGAGPLERGLNILDRLHGLSVSIPDTHDSARLIRRGG